MAKYKITYTITFTFAEKENLSKVSTDTTYYGGLYTSDNIFDALKLVSDKDANDHFVCCPDGYADSDVYTRIGDGSLEVTNISLVSDDYRY